MEEATESYRRIVQGSRVKWMRWTVVRGDGRRREGVPGSAACVLFFLTAAFPFLSLYRARLTQSWLALPITRLQYYTYARKIMLVPEMSGGGERNNRLLALAALALLGCMSSLQLAEATDTFNVGDGAGWTTATNYTQWANQYTFREGDTIVFLYSRGSHDVLRVNQKDFLTCSPSSPIETDASGETAFQLRAGGYYFICGFPEHCRQQQRVYIKVLPPLGPLPDPSIGGTLPAYSQSADGPGATALAVPAAAPRAASLAQPFARCLLALIVTALSSLVCFPSRRLRTV